MTRTRSLATSLLALLLLAAAGCSPEVGSAEWCANMQEKPKGDWTANELADFTRHCVAP